jgi:SAM-dependent methyltransferase
MTTSNQEMHRIWNELSGPKWVSRQEELDAQLAPFGVAVLDRVALRAGERVLDVGTGSGALALEALEVVGPEGSVVGVDVSSVLLARARVRSEAEGRANVEWRYADAQTATFEPTFDAVISRFGVMFFDDPVAAFTNLRRAMKPSGRLSFACWRSVPENPWMLVPCAAVSGLLAVPPQADAEAPGPFAFASRDRIERILAASGYRDVEVGAWDGDLSLGGEISLDAAVDLVLDIGPTAVALREAGPSKRDAVRDAVRESLAPYYDGRSVRMPAAGWIVHARV